MNFLFVHQNFPAQYLHLAQHLAAQPNNQVVFITQRADGAQLRGIRNVVYKPGRKSTPGIHHYLRHLEEAVVNGQCVARTCLDLMRDGFVPDVMLAHSGWGEANYLKDVFPAAPLIGYFEFYYGTETVSFGAGWPTPDTGPRLRTRNATNLIALEAADIGQCPTEWQRSTYPAVHQPKLQVVHEGIDTRIAIPNPDARFHIPGTGIELAAGDEIVTYVARNLEPHRGFPSFMRSLPIVLAQRPQARVLIVGGDGASYGPMPDDGRPYREHLLDELGDSFDHSRVHFLGKLSYSDYLRLLQVSRVHVYLTFPFVLSWSMLEAMAVGCLVVGSRTPPVEEVIQHGENGLLAYFHSAKDIARKTIEALASPQDYIQVRHNARNTVIERYDLQKVCLPAQLELLNRAASAV